MSFSSTTKNELCHLNFNSKCCLYSELAAILRVNAAIRISGYRDANIKITTENAALARKVFTIIKKLFKTLPEVVIRKSVKLKKHNIYIIVLAKNPVTWEILKQTGFIEDNGQEGYKFDSSIGKSIIKGTCCQKAFLRGAFLGSGALSDPEKTYHLEITLHSRQLAGEIVKIINLFGLGAKIIKRKSAFVIYLKEGEHIVDFLNIIGAHNALLELENIRILKEMRNNVNRVVNCETANIEKTVNASLRQIENIKYIRDNIGFEKLQPGLREIAERRLAYSEASLKELGEMLDIPIGKSGVNHRLRKLDEIAEELKNLKGEL